jgi:LysM repeat protein
LRNADLARRSAGQTSRNLPGNRREPLIYIVGGLVLLAILLVVFIGKTGDGPRDGHYADLEGRIKRLEQKLVRIEMMDLRIAQLEGKVTEFNVLIMDRLEKIEKTLPLLQAQKPVEKQETRPKQPETRVKAEAAPAAKERPAKAKEALYHEVEAGETLYRISRTYGLSVEELMRMNNLDPGAPIRKGQRLRVGPVEGR